MFRGLDNSSGEEEEGKLLGLKVGLELDFGGPGHLDFMLLATHD